MEGHKTGFKMESCDASFYMSTHFPCFLYHITSLLSILPDNLELANHHRLVQV